MSALLALVLAAADLTPPPTVESPDPPPAEVKAAPRVEPEPESEPDPTAQLTFGALSAANGLWVGLNTTASFGGFIGSGAGFAVGGLLGLGAGIGLTYYTWGLTGDWGRALLLDSLMTAGAFGGIWVASRRFVPTNEIRYAIAAGLDVACTAGAVALALHVKPRTESVWLADSLAVWGAVVGNLLVGVVEAPEHDPMNLILGGAAAGGLAGGLLAFSASRMSARRFWMANGGALLGGLLLSGALWLVELARDGQGPAFQSAVPAVGGAAGIAGGFLVGFVLSE